MRKLFIRLLDWASHKLDQSICKAMERGRKKAVPASPGPETGITVTNLTFYFTPDRPDPIRREIEALTGKAEAVNYPRGS